MRSLRPALLAGLLTCVAAGASWATSLPPTARAEGAEDQGHMRVAATLLFDVTQVKPGDSFRVGLRFELHPGWHLYWRNPGESGLGTEISWDADRMKVGELQWPFPETFRTADGFIVTYGYEDEVLLFAQATASGDLTQASKPLISAAADLLVCEINCIPAELVVSRTLKVGDKTVPDVEAFPLFDAAQARVPKALSESPFTASAALTSTLKLGEEFAGTVTFTPPKDLPVGPDFFVPDVMPGIEKLSLAAPTQPGVFPLAGKAAPESKVTTPRLRGVIRLGTAETGYEAYELDLPLAAFDRPPLVPTPTDANAAVGSGSSPDTKSAQPGGTGLPLPLALLFAFLGGAILNLMPCVFPVLALKVYGFGRIVHEEQGKKAGHALAYTLGIVASMAALAAAVVAVRAAGHGVGWGFQFQEPLFVAAVAAVLVAFALNLFGVFDVGQPGGGALAAKVEDTHGAWRSAGEGVLAVVLATPCSAPLLGTAVGFGIAAGALTTFAVFVAIGLGLAAPFALLVYIPGLAKRLPKPGAWMEHLKKVLGFALLGTAVWLVWVLGGLSGVDGMARVLAFLVAVALGAWVYGLVQRGAGSGPKRWLGYLVAAVLVAVSGAFALQFSDDAPQDASRAAALEDGAPWSEDAVQGALAAGRPVFIDFTADWCITCKFNERTVLATDPVRKAFAEKNVAFFVGDWTRRDEAISNKLAEFGRAGVPLYLVLSPHRPDAPVLLPELLTVDRVVEAVTHAADPRANPS